MFKKVKNFLKNKKQLDQPVQAAQPDAVVNHVNQNDKKEGDKEINKKTLIDEAVLRYLIVGANNFVDSTAIKERWCYYIFVKPGMIEDLLKISNIDFVQAIYADHGINTRKHVSHLGGKEQEVLFIPSAEVAAFDSKRLNFLKHTAPVCYDDSVNRRETEIINKIYRARNVKSNLGQYIVEDKQY